MREFFYNGITRLDWGFGNPNITGSLIALIMLAAWLLAWLPRWWGSGGFGLALLINVTLGVMLVQTFSRGAVASLLVGVVVLLWYAPRPWKKGRSIAIAIAVIGLAVYAFQLGFTDRTLHGLSGEDRSVTNRWLIYKVVPRMILDAPEGWGHERAAEAFRQWYQPIGRMETYGRLVSSHATWLVEWPWYCRLGYLAGWLTVFALVTPAFLRRPPTGNEESSATSRSSSSFAWASVALAVWLTFFVGSCFTAIAHRWQLWLVPGTVLLIVLVARLWKWTWPRRAAWALWGACTALSVAGLFIAALLTESPVGLKKGIVTIDGGSAAKETWLLPGIDETVLGQFYGHRLRTSCSTQPCHAWIRWTPGAPLPGQATKIICVGSTSKNLIAQDQEIFEKAANLTFLNPDEPAPWLQAALNSQLKATCKFGSFAAGSSRYLWQALAANNPQIKFQTVEGKGRFIGTIDEILH